MTNEQRAEKIIEKYGFDFENIPKEEIIALIEAEHGNFQEGSSEYIRLLCGYLFCIGDASDVPLIKRVKYGINMDVGCMIDWEWIESLENGGQEMDRKCGRFLWIAEKKKIRNRRDCIRQVCWHLSYL